MFASFMAWSDQSTMTVRVKLQRSRSHKVEVPGTTYVNSNAVIILYSVLHAVF